MKRTSSRFMPPPVLTEASAVGVLWQGVQVYGLDGKPLRLVALDEAGQVKAEGEALSRELWFAALDSYWYHLRELGVMTEPDEPTIKNGRPVPAVHH